MVDELSLQIVSLFLFFNVLFLANYLWRRLGGSTSLTSVRADSFLVSCLFILAVTVVGLAMLGPERALLAFDLGAGAVLSIIHPVIAVSMLIALLLLRPWEILQNNPLLDTVPKLFAFLTLLSWLIFILKNNKAAIFWNRVCTLFAAFVAWLALAAIFSGQMTDQLSFLFGNFFPIVVILMLIINTVATRRDLLTLRGSLVLAVTGVIANALYVTLKKSDGALFTVRLECLGLLGNANDLAALIALAAPFTVMPFVTKGVHGLQKVRLVFVNLVLVSGLIISQSRGAMLALVAGGLVYVAFSRKLTRRTIIILAMVIVIPVLLLSAIKRNENEMEASSESRWNYAIAGFRMARVHPIFGVGLDQYPKNYERYSSLFLEYGERTAHSSWVLVLAETGFMGLLLFASLYFSTVKYAFRLRRIAPEYMIAMITYGFAMSFLSHTYLFFPYLLIGFVLAATRILSADTVKAAEPDVKKSGDHLALPATAVLAALALLPVSRAHAETRIVAVSSSDKPLGNYMPRTAAEIKLKGSRGEVLNFMLTGSVDGCQPVSLGSLTGPSGTITPALSLFAMTTITTKKPSFPGAYVGPIYDPLIPLAKPLLCASGSGPLWAWGELSIPADAPPGTYRGSLAIGAATALPIELRVWRMTIPDRPALPAYYGISTWYTLMGHYGKWHSGEGRLSQIYQDEMAKHRIAALGAGTSDPPLSADGSYLDIWSKGSAEDSFASVTLDHRPAWAYFDMPSAGRSGHEPIDWDKAAKVFKATEGALKKLNRPGEAIVYMWDEPKPSMWPDLVRLAQLIKRQTPSMRTMVTTVPTPELDPYIDIFCPVMNNFARPRRPSQHDYRELQKQGKEVWWYVSCESHGCESMEDPGTPDMVIDRTSAYVRSIAWLSSRYSIDAFLYYTVTFASQFYPQRDPWNDIWDFTGNGDGTVMYPGRPGEHGFREHTAVPSVRLKLWREASYDAEYLKWINSIPHKPQWWPLELRRLANSPTTWKRDYSEFQAMRDRIGDYLDALPEGSRGAS